MGRKKGREKPESDDRRVEGIATRFVSVGSHEAGFEKVKQVLKYSTGKTEIEGYGPVFYANGETREGETILRVTVEGRYRDTVRLIFEAAIERVGFELE